jgi:hypothetical protein
MANGERRPATTIGELDVHLSYVGDELREIRQKLQNMATTEDIQDLSNRLQNYATLKDLRALEEKVNNNSLWAAMTTFRGILATFVVFVAAVSAAAAVLNWIRPGSL